MAALDAIRFPCPRCGVELVIDATLTPDQADRSVARLAVMEESMRQALDHIRSHVRVNVLEGGAA